MDKKLSKEIIVSALNKRYSKKVCNKIYTKLSKLFADEKDCVKYNNKMYQKIGEIITANSDEDIDTIINGKEGWESSVYDDIREKFREKIDVTKDIIIEEGVFQCRNKTCKSKRCYTTQSQTRSADEGFTVTVVCTKCGERYTFN